MNKRNTQNSFIRTVKKFFYSAFVAVTFIAYALENHGTPAVSSVSVTGGQNPTTNGNSSSTTASTATTSNGYKDGVYTGSSVDIRWGYVQVQAKIQNGQITDIQFLQYPNERTTSVRINTVAVPDLQQEAIQAQSANVNIITGATLTSEGFQQSLQAALSQAKG